MAGDRQMTQRNAVKWKCFSKVYKFKAHEDTYDTDFIVGFAGNMEEMMIVQEFFSNPEAHKKCPVTKGLSGLVLTSKGHIFTFTNPATWIGIDAPFAAIGSGSEIALGAMYAGASPKDAVKAAGNVDPFTGMGIKSLSFK